MRIIQIIDSLEAGGAERMAVNYANALSKKIEFSGLVASRKEGALLHQLDSKVSYLCLNKKSALDLTALFKLRKYVLENKVTVVHAHSTSFFLGVLLKMTVPKIQIIWHEHYGARANQTRVDNLLLLISSFFFSSVFVVNHQLEAWAKKTLFTKKVCYIPNFATSAENQKKDTLLLGNAGKRIVCLANLKAPKNHISLLTAFKEMKLYDLGWSLHFIGKDYNDNYSNRLKTYRNENNLNSTVFIYDSQNDIPYILSQATIGVLCSTSEGFPVSLLEYGLAKLAVVSTNVGYCHKIIKDNYNGLLFDPLNEIQLQQQLQKMILDKQSRSDFGLHLHELVVEKYSKERVIQLLLSEYSRI